MLNEKKYLRLNDISSYKIAFNLSNVVWHNVVGWDFFAKTTIGEQFVTAMDSISANIAEGFARYTKKDKIHFYRYSLGSISESLDWNEKAFRRNLLTSDVHHYILSILKQLHREVRELIRFTNSKLHH